MQEIRVGTWPGLDAKLPFLLVSERRQLAADTKTTVATCAGSPAPYYVPRSDGQEWVGSYGDAGVEGRAGHYHDAPTADSYARRRVAADAVTSMQLLFLAVLSCAHMHNRHY